MNQAIVYRRFGGPEALELTQLTQPQPGPGEVRVRVAHAGLNPLDARTLAGSAPIRVAELVHRLRDPGRWPGRGPARFPRVVGRDFSGVVDAVGPGVTSVAPGQPVLGTLRSAPGEATTAGSVVQYLVAPADELVILPDGLDPRVAAALGVSAQTACGALRTLRVGPGDVLVVTAAAGGVGSVASQLAVRRGAVVVAVAGARHDGRIRSWGAVPVDRQGDVAAAVHAVAPQVTCLLDCHGGYAGLGSRLGVPAGRVGTLVPSPSMLRHRARFTGSRDARPGDLAEVAALVARGAVQVRLAGPVGFVVDEVAAAMRELLGGHADGKLVVELA